MTFMSKSQLWGIITLTIVLCLIWLGLTTLSIDGKLSLSIFTIAIFTWSLTKIDATFVALLATIAMSFIGEKTDKTLLNSLGDPFIVFIIAGFMLGGAYKVSGLSETIARQFAKYAHKVSDLFYLLTTALVVLSFVVPSTSARAAMLMPIYMALSKTTDNVHIRKGLALLFPTIIVLSCVISYLGAGANLMTANFIYQYTQQKISYFDWLILGAPFGIVSCYLSTFVILRLFLSPSERAEPFKITLDKKEDRPHTNARQKTLLATFLLILLWMTEGWHKVDASTIALCGVLLLCLPNYGVLSIKQAFKEVEWSLVVFMAATIELSHSLEKHGIVAYITQIFKTTTQNMTSPIVIVLILTTALLSHLLIHSRTARAAVFMPILIPLGISTGHSGLLIAFFANAAMGYCLTLPICAKPVAMFSTADGDGYSTGDLLRLSLWLLPLHLILLLLAFSLYK